jgi:T5SS/PEP-CTERM-associated repeat protein
MRRRLVRIWFAHWVVWALGVGGLVPATHAAEICTGDFGIGFFGEFVVGIDAVGSCSLDGTQVSYVGLSIGQNPTGNGTVTVTQSQVSLVGTINRLGVGEQGTGVMTLSQGTVVDGSGGLCVPTDCNFFVGNGAGSTGALTVADVGTRLVTVNAFVIGAGGVFTQANDGFDFGIPGGATIASFSILNGAVVESESAEVSAGATGGSPTGAETSDATVTVDGDGSRWILEGSLSVSPGPNATSHVTVSNGGLISVPQLSLATHPTSVATLRILDSASVEAGGLRVAEEAGSRGTVEISNARLTNHPTEGQWILGGLGEAKLSIRKAGEIVNDQNFGVIVAQGAGSTAKISLNGAGSLFDAGTILGLGWDLNTNSPGRTCDISLDAGAVMRADHIIVGPGCTIKGKGTLQGVITNNGGTISPKVTNFAVLVPAQASGFFGFPSAGAADLVPAYTFTDAGQQVTINATGTIYLVTPSSPTNANGLTLQRSFIIGGAPSGFLPLEEVLVDAGSPVPITDGSSTILNVGALIGAFVPESIAAQPNFVPRDEDVVTAGQVGISSSGLFLVGAGPVSFTAPGPGRLYLGINEPFVSNNAGSFAVGIALTP